MPVLVSLNATSSGPVRTTPNQERAAMIMSPHKLDVYLGSYTSKPILSAETENLSINIGDVITKEDWLRLLSGSDAQLELRVKVEDIKHLFWDEDSDYIHGMTVKVVAVDSDGNV